MLSPRQLHGTQAYGRTGQIHCQGYMPLRHRCHLAKPSDGSAVHDRVSYVEGQAARGSSCEVMHRNNVPVSKITIRPVLFLRPQSIQFKEPSCKSTPICYNVFASDRQNSVSWKLVSSILHAINGFDLGHAWGCRDIVGFAAFSVTKRGGIAVAVSW